MDREDPVDFINRVFAQLTQPNCIGKGDPKLYFLGGLRWHYFRVDAGRRYYMYAYSTVRNFNGKFVSWVYKPYYEYRMVEGKRKKIMAWNFICVRETRRYKSAKTRAEKMSFSHRKRLGTLGGQNGA